MKYVSSLYQKNKKLLTLFLFPVILFFYPLLTINQGIDVSDSLYSLTNFRFFPQMEGMWIISTYLSNVIGYIFTLLPFGTTVLGMKLYTGLIVSITTLVIYGMLKRWMPAWIAFLGEIIAVSYCWIPTTILYNYLTYFFLSLGILFLYKGLVEENNSALVLAGIFLGMNVWVRIPNITEMAFILGLWYYLRVKKREKNEMIGKTAYCIAGYLFGMVLPLMGILVQYGFSGLEEMIAGLTAVGDQDSTYSLGGMVLSTIMAYLKSGKWVFFLLLGIFMGMTMFFCLKERWEKLQQLVYLAGILILFRFFWGRGMFTFRYYEDYTSMYEWGMIGLYLCWIGSVILLRSTKSSQEEKLLALLSILILIITPLGSNNYTYQNLNNLFLAAPITLYIYVKLFRRRGRTRVWDRISFPWKAMAVALAGMILIQGVGFHISFVFRDGMRGEKREYTFTAPFVVAGMKTNIENGTELKQVLEQLAQTKEEEILLFGDCPGISFLSGKVPAIHTAWPDLESESYEKIKGELEAIEGYPTVVVRQKEYDTKQGKKKKELMENFVQENRYRLIFKGKTYEIYEK